MAELNNKGSTVKDVTAQQISKELGSLVGLLGQLLGGPLAALLTGGDRRFAMMPGMSSQGSWFGGAHSALTNSMIRSFDRGFSPSLAVGGFEDIATRMQSRFFNNTLHMMGYRGAELSDTTGRLMSNPLARMGYSLLDPYGMTKAIPKIADTVAYYQTRTGGFMDMGALRKGMDVFRGPGGVLDEWSKSPSSFGGFSLSAVADISREVMFSSGYKGQDPGKIKQNIKDMASALEPLKDIFNEDIPALFNTLEGITGQRVVDASRARSLAGRITSTLRATGTSIQQYGASADQMLTGLYDKSGRNRAILGVDALTSNYLLRTAGVSAAGITSAEIQSIARNTERGTATSNYATMYANGLGAFSLGYKGGTPEQLKAMYDESLRKTGLSGASAIEKLTGKSSSELSVYSNAKAAIWANQNNAGGEAASALNMDLIRKRMQDRYGNLKGYLGNNDKMAELGSMTLDQIRDTLGVSGDEAAKIAETFRYSTASVLGGRVRNFEDVRTVMTTYGNKVEAGKRAKQIALIQENIKSTGFIDMLNSKNPTLQDAVASIVGVAQVDMAKVAGLKGPEADQYNQLFQHVVGNQLTYSSDDYLSGQLKRAFGGKTPQERSASLRTLTNYMNVDKKLFAAAQGIDKKAVEQALMGDTAADALSDIVFDRALKDTESGKFGIDNQKLIQKHKAAIEQAISSNQTGSRDGFLAELKAYSGIQDADAAKIYSALSSAGGLTAPASREVQLLESILEEVKKGNNK